MRTCQCMSHFVYDLRSGPLVRGQLHAFATSSRLITADQIWSPAAHTEPRRGTPFLKLIYLRRCILHSFNPIRKYINVHGHSRSSIHTITFSSVSYPDFGDQRQWPSGGFDHFGCAYSSGELATGKLCWRYPCNWSRRKRWPYFQTSCSGCRVSTSYWFDSVKDLGKLWRQRCETLSISARCREREGNRDRERERERQSGRKRERERGGGREREREGDSEREGERERVSEWEREREGEREYMCILYSCVGVWVSWAQPSRTTVMNPVTSRCFSSLPFPSELLA